MRKSKNLVHKVYIKGMPTLYMKITTIKQFKHFSFFISKRYFIEEEPLHMNKIWTQRCQIVTKNEQYGLNTMTIKSAMEVVEVKLHTQDQSNNELAKNSKLAKLSKSSIVRRLCSHQTVHIKHKGTKVQTSEECFPNQFPHPNKRSTTHPGNTHWIQKKRNT